MSRIALRRALLSAATALCATSFLLAETPEGSVQFFDTLRQVDSKAALLCEHLKVIEMHREGTSSEGLSLRSILFDELEAQALALGANSVVLLDLHERIEVTDHPRRDDLLSVRASVVALNCPDPAPPLHGERENTLVHTRRDLEDYADRWLKRDGAAAFVISDYFIDFLIEHPGVLLATMHDRPEVFESWLDRLQNLSFTAYGGCCGRESLECKRSASIRALDLVHVDPHLESLRVRLRQRLTEITVREVD